jgi:hypothetical protein
MSTFMPNSWKKGPRSSEQGWTPYFYNSPGMHPHTYLCAVYSFNSLIEENGPDQPYGE